MLLDYGANVNAENGTALTMAVETYNIQMINLLISYKIDIRGKDGAAQFALKRGYADIVDMLLENGAILNIKTGDPISEAMQRILDIHGYRNEI